MCTSQISMHLSLLFAMSSISAKKRSIAIAVGYEFTINLAIENSGRHPSATRNGAGGCVVTAHRYGSAASSLPTRCTAAGSRRSILLESLPGTSTSPPDAPWRLFFPNSKTSSPASLLFRDLVRMLANLTACVTLHSTSLN